MTLNNGFVFGILLLLAHHSDPSASLIESIIQLGNHICRQQPSGVDSICIISITEQISSELLQILFGLAVTHDYFIETILYFITYCLWHCAALICNLIWSC